MSVKLRNLEEMLDSVGLIHWRVGYRRTYCSGSVKAYEAASYLVRPSKKGESIDQDIRRKLAVYADQVGLYVKFSAIDMHAAFSAEIARTGKPFLGVGVVATFYPKFPYSQAKKVLREIQASVKDSFGYYQEDSACLKKLQASKIVEKDVLSISKVDTDYLIYTGSEELHPLTRVAYLVDAYVGQHGSDESEDHIRDLNAIMFFGKLDLHAVYGKD